MGLTNFEIIFDNSSYTYHRGQQVTGRVLLTVDSPKTIRGIIIKFKGEAEVKFHETKQTRDKDGKLHNQTITCTSSETYFENKYHLFGNANGEFTLPAGEHCYPFQTTLPEILPSSFEGECGHVRYTIKVTVDRPWKFDQEVKAAFTVISPLDLNFHQTAKNPVKVTKEKYFSCCCCFCRSGPLTVVISLPASGYVPGQEIPVTVEVDNASLQRVSGVTCALRKIVTFYAKHPHKTSKIVKNHIEQVSFGAVGENGSATWTQMIKVPSLPPSNLTNCAIIDVDYEMKLEGHIASCCHSNVEVKIPIVIGTVPLAGFGTVQLARLGAIEPTAPENYGWNRPQIAGEESPLYPQNAGVQPFQGPSPAYFQFPGYPEPSNSGLAAPHANPLDALPPPSYDECVFGGKNIQDDGDNKYLHGNLDFTPRYPVYNYQPSAPPPPFQ